ncbi:MAG: helix-turn-helix domain-containing protein [Halopseudomonas aestusnigri]
MLCSKNCFVFDLDHKHKRRQENPTSQIGHFSKKMVEQTESMLIKSHFDDFEEFCESIQGWGLEFKQLDRGLFSTDLYQISTPEVLLTNVNYDRRLAQTGSQPLGMRTFAIMAEQATPFIWRMQEMMKDRFIIFPKNGELDAVSIEGFEVYTISLADHVVEEKLLQNGDPALAEKLKTGGVVEVKTAKIKSLRRFLRQIYSEITQQPELLTRRSFQQRLCDGVTSCIFDVLDCSEEGHLTLPFCKRAKIVKNIKSWLEETDPEFYSVNGLCHALQINERTMQRIIKKWYGVSPQQYLLAIRLNGARKDLCTGPRAKILIADIANRWGFWHMGMFAMVYRRQFRELPSETLRHAL